MLDAPTLYHVAMKATVCVVAATFAAVVLLGGWRRRPNVFLAVFLVLIALNQGVEALRVGAKGLVADAFLVKAAWIAAAADPFFLYYFASLFPERNRLNRMPYVALVGLFSVTFLVFVPWFQGYSTGVSRWFSTAWEVFTATVYGIVFVRFLSIVRADERRLPSFLLYLAMAVAFVPVVPRVFRQFVGASGLALDAFLHTVVTVYLPLALVAAAMAFAILDAGAGVRRRVFWGGAVGLGTALVTLLQTILGGHGFSAPSVIDVSFQTSAALRWLMFSALASVAVVRYDTLGMRLATRRQAARLLVALGVGVMTVILFALAYVGLGSSGIEIRPVDVVILVLILALSQGYRSLIDRVASVIYGVPPRGDQGAKIAMYQTAVAQAEQRGRTLETEHDLERLRDELELDPKIAEVVARMSTARTAGRLAPGEIVHGRYQVGRLLGRGASGRVFEAKDQLLDRDVVLKEVVAPGATEETRVLEEARLAGRIDHPNVLRVHDALPWEGGILLVTERLDGGTLADRLKQQGPLQPAEAARIFDGILGGLEAVHRESIVHRDLKPANILLTARGTPKIADFGVATARAAATVQGNDKLWGTPDYMAPEQLRGERASPQSDLYSVGVMMARSVAEPGDAWREVMKKAQATRPEARWLSAEAMRVALRQAARAPTTPAGAGDAHPDPEPRTI